MIHFLYPSAAFSKTEPDDVYLAEFIAAQKAGICCSVYSDDDWQQGTLKIFPVIKANSLIIYRGWMLSIELYNQLASALQAQSLQLLTSNEQYLNTHYLPRWYSLCKEWTPETIFPKINEDLATLLANHPWHGYFIKDYVKSLTTKRGSIAYSADEAKEIIQLLKQYRGKIEGGICIRRVEHLQPETEERYFIFKQQPFGRTNEPIPPIISDLIDKIDSPFFSADVVLNQQNKPRLIELGDGQVSDIKKWTPAQFIRIFQSAIS